MKNTRLFLYGVFTACALAALSAGAQTSTNESPKVLKRTAASVVENLKPTKEPLFTGSELDLDLAGTYTAGESEGISHLFEHNIRHGAYGLNFGGTYFMTKNFGTGCELGIYDLKNPAPRILDYMNVTATARLPLGPVCPYVIGAIGTDFRDGSYNVQAGPGVEWRVSKSASVFTDARYVWRDARSAEDRTALAHSRDALTARFGLRFSFR